MNKFIVIWHTGEIRHIIAPSYDILLNHLPEEDKWQGLSIPTVLKHPASPVDFGNDNTEIFLD